MECIRKQQATFDFSLLSEEVRDLTVPTSEYRLLFYFYIMYFKYCQYSKYWNTLLKL